MSKFNKLLVFVLFAMVSFFVFNGEVYASEVPTYNCIYNLTNSCKVTISGNIENSSGFDINYNCSPSASGIKAGGNIVYSMFKNDDLPYCPKICSNVKLSQKKFSGDFDFSSSCSGKYKYIEASDASTINIPDSYIKPTNTKTCSIFSDGSIAFKITYNYDNKTYTLDKFGKASGCNLQNTESQLKTKIDNYFKKYENNLGANCDPINATIHSKQGVTNCALFTSESGGTGGTSVTTDNDVTGNDINSGEGNFNGYQEIQTGEALDCESFKGTKTYGIINTVFGWIQIAAPIMLVIFGVMDFGQAVLSGDNDALKKAQAKFVKRVIITVVLILLPIIMNLLVTLMDGVLGNDVSGCNIGQ